MFMLRSPDSALMTQIPPKERMHICPNPDSYLTTCFFLFYYKIPSNSSQCAAFKTLGKKKKKDIRLLWHPLPGKAIKAIFPFTQNSVSAFLFSTKGQWPSFSNTISALVYDLQIFKSTVLHLFRLTVRINSQRNPREEVKFSLLTSEK